MVMKYTDINSHEAACNFLGKSPADSTNIHDQLDDIADAINILDGDYVADFQDKNQKKWRPYFIVDSSGFRFDCSYYVDSLSYTSVGSRLCQYFRSEESANFYGKTFLAMHEKCFNKRRPVAGAPTTFRDLRTHQDACKVLGKAVAISTTTDQRITDIVNAMNKLNGNFKADFNNADQRKYRPFFIMDASGFRFLGSYCADSDSSTGVGSRLCHYVATKEEADHLGTQFLELHKEHYMGE